MATSEPHKNNHTHDAAFHTTRWSLVLAAQGNAARSLWHSWFSQKGGS